MPKVTSTRREDDAGERKGERERERERERNRERERESEGGIVGVMVQIGRMGDSPRSGYFMESLSRVCSYTLTLTKLAPIKGQKGEGKKEAQTERTKRRISVDFESAKRSARRD